MCVGKDVDMILTDDQLDAARDRVCTVLRDVGLEVQSDQIASLLIGRGCSQRPNGRLAIPRELIDEFVASRPPMASGPNARGRAGADAGAPRPRLLPMHAFGCGPTKYHDFDTGQTVRVDTDIFTRMIQFADATPDICYARLWFRHDVPQATQALEDTILGYKLSDKTGGTDVINPALLPYQLEASRIISGDFKYVGVCQCMTPPIVLGRRSGDKMCAMRAHGMRRHHVATMVAIGANTPLDLSSATVLGAAEVVAGMIAAYVLEPDAVITGSAHSTVMDMRSGSLATNAPEKPMCDVAIATLINRRFGGHARANMAYGPDARSPGLQAVFENFLSGASWPILLDEPPTYPGHGTLGADGIGSPVQTMLDIEVRKALDAVGNAPMRDTPRLGLDQLCEVVDAKADFLSHEHTFAHFRRLWSPDFLLRGNVDNTESAILKRCDRAWKENLARYEPPERDPHALRALDELVRRARAELVD
jgi:trimethylamine:corrinoid methyltransferase-like protein